MLYNHELPEQRRLSAIYQVRERLYAHTFHKQQDDFRFIEITPPSPYNYDKYDMIIWSGESLWLTEIKIRSCNSNSFLEAIIEEGKFNTIVKFAEQRNCQPYYFCFYKDGKVAVFNLNSANKKEVNLLREDRKEIHSKTKTDKPCYMLSLASATIYEYPTANIDYDAWAKKICSERFPNNDFNLGIR
jgi:hypothetical protein